MGKKTLLNQKEVEIILNRLACQLIENHDDFAETVVIGLQPRGIYLSQRLQHLLREEYGLRAIKFGKLDITFYRDDFMRSDKMM